MSRSGDPLSTGWGNSKSANTMAGGEQSVVLVTHRRNCRASRVPMPSGRVEMMESAPA
ncbi:hypothetical protein [Peterkaempfera griseoplana]|uniref:hypothetical protein n=1 Tax=Peterkaempfera griseoplana TaxID=66896 RepID=UPI00147009D2|nr:hypothetical protein [Peterkaempfera griseoplana]